MKDNTTLSPSVTGSHTTEQTKEITYPFDRYIIEVQVTETGKFVGISGIRVNKDFLSYSQKLSVAQSHNVEEYYAEDDK